MKITGTSMLAAEPALVWRALNDPAVLVRTIPGCRRLEALGDDAFKMTVAAGVGSIKGVYDGEVRLSEQQEPGSFRMQAQGAGAPGTIGANVFVTLADGPDGGTSLTYDADAVVGGMIGGVGQRMLTGVSKKMAAEFFTAVDAHLSGALVGAGLSADGGAPEPSGLPPGPSIVAPPSAAQPAAGAVGQVFTAPEVPSGRPGGSPAFVVGAIVGAAAALAGALVGGWLARRRTDIGAPG